MMPPGCEASIWPLRYCPSVAGVAEPRQHEDSDLAAAATQDLADDQGAAEAGQLAPHRHRGVASPRPKATGDPGGDGFDGDRGVGGGDEGPHAGPRSREGDAARG